MALFTATLGVALLAGAVVMVWPMLRATRESVASLDWPQAQGLVLASDVLRSQGPRVRGTDTVYHTPRVTYRYSVDGIEYVGDRVDALEGPRSEDEAREAIRGFDAGRMVVVRYDPAAPATSVLRPGAWVRATRLIVPGGWTMFSAIAFAFAAMYALRSRATHRR